MRCASCNVTLKPWALIAILMKRKFFDLVPTVVTSIFAMALGLACSICTNVDNVCLLTLGILWKLRGTARKLILGGETLTLGTATSLGRSYDASIVYS